MQPTAGCRTLPAFRMPHARSRAREGQPWLGAVADRLRCLLTHRQVLDYLRTGVEAGMVVPDAADTKLESVRVLIEDAGAD